MNTQTTEGYLPVTHQLQQSQPRKTIVELLMDAPQDQIRRLHLAANAVAAGNWHDAAHYLLNASRDTAGQWSADARDLSAHCEEMAAKHNAIPLQGSAA